MTCIRYFDSIYKSSPEMHMLRYRTGVSYMDRIKNYYIRGSLGVVDIRNKMREHRLRWFGHVLRTWQGYPMASSGG